MPTDDVDEFDSAKAIYEKLKDIPEERREMVLRWVCERLGIALPAARQPDRPAEPLDDDDDDQDDDQPSSPPGRASVDIKSFVASKKPRSDTQFAAVVAHYYQFAAPEGQRRASINAKGLQDAARLAGRAVLKSPKATLNNAIKAGYLDRGARGEFRINTVGENLVTMTMSGEKPAGAARKRAAKK